MTSFVSNVYFQMLFGALISFAGSVWANRLYYGKLEKSRAEREAKRAYNKLASRLVQTTISDINHPLHVLPVDISDRIEDLQYALEDVDRRFQLEPLVQEAIKQAAGLRKQQEELYSSKAPEPEKP